jgi:hypothetical protein
MFVFNFYFLDTINILLKTLLIKNGTSFSRLRTQGPQTPSENAQIENALLESYGMINTCFGVIPKYGYMSKCVFH